MLTHELIQELCRQPGVNKHMVKLHLESIPESKVKALDCLRQDALFYNMSRETFRAIQIGLEKHFEQTKTLEPVLNLS